MTTDDWSAAVARHPDGATVAVRVVPRASRTRVVGPYGEGRLKIKLAAPPVEGAANDALLAFLADRCGVRASEVELLAGERSRDKVALVRGVPAQRLVQALGADPGR